MGQASGTEVEELILCKNPRCPSRKGGRYKAGRAWSLHMTKSPSCRVYYDNLAEDGASDEVEVAESGDVDCLMGGNCDEVNEERVDPSVDPREWRTEWMEGVGLRSQTQQGTYWEQRRYHEDPLNPCAPWRDTTELELAEWLIFAGLPETKIDEFLNLKYVSSLLASLSFPKLTDRISG